MFRINNYYFKLLIYVIGALGAACALIVNVGCGGVTKAPNSSTSVSVTPATASIQPSAMQQFSAKVNGGTSSGFTWYATGGTISSNGLYTAPSAPGTYTVQATSAADSSKLGTATVTVVGNATSSGSPSVHSVDLTWSPSTSSVAGYLVYRGTAPGGPYSRLISSADPSTSYSDANVQSGATYYYVVTSVDGSGQESGFSNQATAAVPAP